MNSTNRQLDPRAPLVFETHGLTRRAGELKRVRRQVPAPAQLGIEMIGVPEGSPIDLELRLESVVEGILVTGTASATLHGECARCLQPICVPQVFALQELYYYADKEADEDANWVQNELLDLEPALRDAIVLELPFTPLCKPDCAGLCPICGADLNAEPAHQHGPAIDPRWQQLTGLTRPGDEKL